MSALTCKKKNRSNTDPPRRRRKDDPIWFLWFIWSVLIKTSDTPPWNNTDPKAPSSLTHTKGLWVCWPSILACPPPPPAFGCCHGDEAVWCSLQQTPAIAAPVDHNHTPWPAFLDSLPPSLEHRHSSSLSSLPSFLHSCVLTPFLT